MRAAPLAAMPLVLMAAAVAQAQGPQGARAGGAPPAGRGGVTTVAETAPKPLIPNAKAVRTCESLAMVALPNTTIESAAVDPSVPGVCRVTAITTALYGTAPRFSYFTGTYDPKALVGTSAGECGTFPEADAVIIRKIWEGPRREDGSFLWYGPARGADLSALSPSRGTPLTAQAFPITVEWFRYFLAEDPQLDWTTIMPARYERFSEQSVEQYGTVIGTDNPDLSAFRASGGKAIVWHDGPTSS